MPRNGLPESIAASTGSTRPRLRSSAMASSKAPTPGSTTFVGRGHHGRVAGDHRLVPDLLEALLHAAKVAHAVVDDGDHGKKKGLGIGD